MSSWLRHGLVGFAALIVLEYLPELVGASKNLDLLRRLHPAWLVTGLFGEVSAWLAYALLPRPLLTTVYGLSWLMRLVLATPAPAHVLPVGAADGAGLGHQLRTAEGVPATETGFVMVTGAIGSAIVR